MQHCPAETFFSPLVRAFIVPDLVTGCGKFIQYFIILKYLCTIILLILFTQSYQPWRHICNVRNSTTSQVYRYIMQKFSKIHCNFILPDTHIPHHNAITLPIAMHYWYDPIYYNGRVIKTVSLKRLHGPALQERIMVLCFPFHFLLSIFFKANLNYRVLFTWLLQRKT